MKKHDSPEHKHRWRTPKIILSCLLTVMLLLSVLGVIGYKTRVANRTSTYVNSDAVRVIEDTEGQGIGSVEIHTLSVPEGILVKRACYSATGKVLLNYQRTIDGEKTSGIAVMDDDGTNFRSIYSGKDTGSRLLPFADNTRILLGDNILECPDGYTLDDCPENSASLYEIVFPEQFTKDKKVVSIWSEVIIAPDNRHMAWTMLRSDCGAAVAMGELEKADGAYHLVDAGLCSRMNTYVEDPEHPGQLNAYPVIGGEVKQFVHGGTAMSLVGADMQGMAQSVVMDIASGEVTTVTNTPGYDETTIFSPNEKYGMTMTTRFSDTTNLSVLGLVPRPYGDALQNVTSTIYMYGVTGVRNEREGNIGPALINIARSTGDPDYVGIDLSDPDQNWVYHSPMSWNHDSTKAMWMEEQRDGTGGRVQIVELLEAEAAEALPSVETPDVGDYADTDPYVGDFSGTVLGKVSGSMTITKETGFLSKKSITVTYDHYSDDGTYFYDGMEYSTGSIISKSVYEADLTVTDADGNVIGTMDVALYFSAAYRVTTVFSGSSSPQLDVSRSHGTATWYEKTADIKQLVP